MEPTKDRLHRTWTILVFVSFKTGLLHKFIFNFQVYQKSFNLWFVKSETGQILDHDKAII